MDKASALPSPLPSSSPPPPQETAVPGAIRAQEIVVNPPILRCSVVEHGAGKSPWVPLSKKLIIHKAITHSFTVKSGEQVQQQSSNTEEPSSPSAILKTLPRNDAKCTGQE